MCEGTMRMGEGNFGGHPQTCTVNIMVHDLYVGVPWTSAVLLLRYP